MATEVGSIRARLVLNNSDFKKKMEDTRNELDKSRLSAKHMKEDFGRIQGAALGLGAAVLAGVGGSTKIAADFEAQMSRVKAISGATESEFKNLQDAALELGAKSSFSASQIAVAFEDMAALGFDANEVIAAMPGVVSAAEAAGSDLATTAGIVASALNSFQMEAVDATKVADILAMTANVSAADINDMGHALKYVGPVANSLGISLEETSAMIGIMTDAGLAGSQAGTSLRQALLSLNNPAKAQAKIMEELGFSMRDADGNAKSLSDIVGGLTEVTKDMTEAERVATISKLVGTEASSGMIAVMAGGVDKIDDFTQALENSGGASQEAADIMKDNLTGAWEEFTGALETVGIKLGNEYLPLLTEFVKGGAEIVSQFSDVEISQIKSALAFGGTTAAIALTISTIGKLALAVRGLMLSMGPAGWIIAGVSLLGGALVGASVGTEDLQEKIQRLSQEFDELDSLDRKIEEFDKLQLSSKLTSDEFARYIDLQSELQKTSDPQVIADLKDEMADLEEKSGFQNGELQTMVDLNNDLIETVPEATTKITDQGNAIIDSTDALKGFSQERLKSLFTDLELSRLATETEYKETLKEEADIISEMQEAQEKLNGLKEEQVLQQNYAEEQQRILNDMLLKENEYSSQQILYQEGIVVESARALDLINQQVTGQANFLIDQGDKLDNIRDEIKGYEDVRFQMIDILLKQEGLTAERGKGLVVVQDEIDALIKERDHMEKNTEAAQMNTDEYREAKKAIDEKIARLQDVHNQIIDITESTSSMNDQMAKSINKPVYVSWNGTTPPPHLRGPVALPSYHTGGVVEKPKLHSGGFPSNFVSQLQSIPLHNEIDVRLLQNEMVLTEGQQANLWRALQGGLIPGDNSNNEPWSDVLRALDRLIQVSEDGRITEVSLDGRSIGQMVEKHVTERQNRNKRISRMFRGY